VTARAEDGFEMVARLADLPPGQLLGVETSDGERVCLVNYDGVVCALSDTCTHQAFPISAGQLLPDGTVECVWHGARFDRLTGAPRRGPALDALARYAVRVHDGDIFVGSRESDAS
jgi:nitrite reductase/ring-hydroxylating ferredoxin subunit